MLFRSFLAEWKHLAAELPALAQQILDSKATATAAATLAGGISGAFFNALPESKQ